MAEIQEKIKIIPCTCMHSIHEFCKTYFDQGLYKFKGKQNKKKQSNVKIL